MNPVLIDLGIVQIYWYSVIVLTAILLGSFLFLKAAKKEGYNEEFLTNTIFYVIIFSIIGVAIKAIIASITITAKSSISVNPFFILSPILIIKKRLTFVNLLYIHLKSLKD